MAGWLCALRWRRSVFVRVRPSVRADEHAADTSSGGKTSALHCQGDKLWLLESAGILSTRPGDARGAARAAAAAFVAARALDTRSVMAHAPALVDLLGDPDAGARRRAVEVAHALAGDAALGNFLEASFLGDGTTSLRAYLSRELRAIEEDAALAAATGWDLSSEETSELRAWMRR